MLHASYDVIVVGAGISGLYAAREVLKTHPSWRVCIAERYKGLGGRTYSYHPEDFPGVSWEMGAGRIRRSHVHLMELIEEYGLHWSPISADTAFKESARKPLVPDVFSSMILPVYFAPLARLSSADLANSTIEELMVRIYGREKTETVLSQFPYRAELNTLRADLALQGFLGDGEMSSMEDYGVLVEGFSELVARLRADLEQRGCVILPRHRLVHLSRVKGHATATDCVFAYGRPKKGEAHGEMVLRAERACVLALHRDAVAELPNFKDWDTLKHLQTKPLLRQYAIFPKGRDGRVWFADMPKIVTPARPRYIIPINAAKGVIMISYTDADDTVPYTQILNEDGEKALERAVIADVRKLFPGVSIPRPLFFRPHAWETGCTYWLPGDYDPVRLSRAAVHPLAEELPGVWLCGESWSMRQAWVEGALEHTRLMLQRSKLE
jgi:hypothetical protein